MLERATETFVPAWSLTPRFRSSGGTAPCHPGWVGTTQRFRYGARPGALIFAAFFFGAAGALLVRAAASGASVRLWPLPLYTSGGPVYVIAAAAFSFVALAIAQMLRSATATRRELVLAETYIEAPRNPWSTKTMRIKKAAIRSVSESETMGTRILVIKNGDAKLVISNRTVGEDGYAATARWLGRGA